MNWEQELSAKAEVINEALDRYLPSADSHPALIHRAMRYSIFAGGKRLRGALALAAAEALGRPQAPLLPAAAALEMIHTYSLIHDDLPAMDDDDLRRGKPTCHKVFGEAIAILAGDALLTLAFETLCRLIETGFATGVVMTVVAEVAAAAGTGGLIGGQVVDLESEGQAIDPDQLEYIHIHKTAALFRAALRAGGYPGGGGNPGPAGPDRLWPELRPGLSDHRRYPGHHRRRGPAGETAAERPGQPESHLPGHVRPGTGAPDCRSASEQSLAKHCMPGRQSGISESSRPVPFKPPILIKTPICLYLAVML